MAVGAVFWILPGGREDQRIVGAARRWRCAIVAAPPRSVARGGVGPMLIQAGREGRYVIIPLSPIGSDSVAEIGASLPLAP